MGGRERRAPARGGPFVSRHGAPRRFFSTAAHTSSITFAAADWIRPFGTSFIRPVIDVTSAVQCKSVLPAASRKAITASTVVLLPIALLNIVTLFDRPGTR